MENEFMGHSVKYWIELEKQALKLDVGHLIQELADAHFKVGFYERRIKEMALVAPKD